MDALEFTAVMRRCTDITNAVSAVRSDLEKLRDQTLTVEERYNIVMQAHEHADLITRAVIGLEMLDTPF